MNLVKEFYKRVGAIHESPLPILIACLLLAHTLFYFFALGNDAVDDAYISFRYAQNAMRGYGLVFNPNERVEGFTNFLWTAMMVPLEGARVDVGRASMLLGVLFALGVMALTVRFAKMVDAPRAVGWIAALLLAVDGSFALWAVGGLETPLFAFLIFAGAVLYVREQEWNIVSHLPLRAVQGLRAPQGRSNLGDVGEIASSPRRTRLLAMTDAFPYSGIFFALAAMTRPEGVLVFAITVAHQAAWRVLAERRLFTYRDIQRMIAFIAIFVPYWLARWVYYHSFLPNSFYAKVNPSGPAAQIERGWNHLSQFVNVHWGWLIVLPPVATILVSHLPLRAVQGLRVPVPGLPKKAPATKQSRTANPEIASQRTLAHLHRTAFGAVPVRAGVTPAFWTTFFVSIVVSYTAYIVYVGGDWSVGRFFVPLLAPFYLLFSIGIVALWNWAVDKLGGVEINRTNKLGIIASSLLAIAIFVASSWNGEYGIYIRGFDAGRATAARETMGKWLKANVPRGSWIAVDAAGQVPYFAELPSVDMFGINDLYIGRLNVESLGKGTPGHEKFDLGYVIGREPTYVVIFGDLFDAIKEYERAPVVWTQDESLKKFLTLYRRRAP